MQVATNAPPIDKICSAFYSENSSPWKKQQIYSEKEWSGTVPELDKHKETDTDPTTRGQTESKQIDLSYLIRTSYNNAQQGQWTH